MMRIFSISFFIRVLVSLSFADPINPQIEHVSTTTHQENTIEGHVSIIHGEEEGGEVVDLQCMLANALLD